MSSLIIITMLITIVLVLAGYYAYMNLPKEVMQVSVSEIPSEQSVATPSTEQNSMTPTTNEQIMPSVTMPPMTQVM